MQTKLWGKDHLFSKRLCICLNRINTKDWFQIPTPDSLLKHIIKSNMAQTQSTSGIELK